MNIANLLQPHVGAAPDRPAIIDGSGLRERCLSFGELSAAADGLAGLLRDKGVGPGDRVLVLLGMSAPLYVALLALFRLGAVATFLDPAAGFKHIVRCCETARPKAVILTPKGRLLRLLSRGLRQIPTALCHGPRWLGGRDLLRPRMVKPLPIAEVESDHPALLTFTSGSTAQPKAAVRSHGMLIAQHAALHEALSLTSGECDLATLPIFALANLASGVTTVIADADLRRPGFVEPAPVLRQIEQYRPTSCVASPAFFERLLEAPAPQPLRHLRRAFTGGAPVFPDLLDRLAEAVSGQAVAVYGSTEAEPVAHVTCDEISEEDVAAMSEGRGLLAGRPVPQVRLAILPNRAGEPIGPFDGAEFAARSLSAGEPGEIVVTGDHVLKGYLDAAGDIETKFRVGGEVWHRTGDAGYLDALGRLWLLGRAGAVVRDAQNDLYPLAVEGAARKLPGVRQCAFIAHAGQRMLVVDPKEPPPPDWADRLCRELNWARIDQVLPVKRLPLDRRHNAKIDYPALRRLVARRLR